VVDVFAGVGEPGPGSSSAVRRLIGAVFEGDDRVADVISAIRER